MARFLLLDSISQYREIARNHRELLDTHEVVTADLGVAMLLEDEGRSFRELWDYLSDAELEAHWEEAWATSRQWHGIATADLVCFGVQPLPLSALEMVLPCETAINASVAFERFLKEERPRELAGAAGAVAIYRNGPQPLYEATATIAQAVLRWHCDRNRIDFRVCNMPRKRRVVPASLLRDPIRSAASDVPSAPRDRPLLMLLDLAQNPRDLATLESELARQRTFRVVRVSELSRKMYPLVPPLPAATDEALRACVARSARTRQSYDGPHPYLYGNPYLEFQFQGMWDEVRRSCEAAAFMAPVLRWIRPDALLLGADCFTREALIREIATNEGIAVGILLHSGLGIGRGYREVCSPADLTFTWGAIDRDALATAGADAARLATVGSLRYFDLCADDCVPSRREGQSEALKERLGFRRETSVVSLLTAPANLGLSQSLADPRQHRSALREVTRWARENPERGLALKPHPNYDHLECYRYLSETFPPNVRFVEDGVLADVLAMSDAAFLLNHCTTAALEAMPAVPVLFMRQGYRRTPSLGTPLDGDMVLQVSSITELTTKLAELAHDPTYREGRMKRQRDFVSDVICDREGKHPVTRISEELGRLLDERATRKALPGRVEREPPTALDGFWEHDVVATVPGWAALFSSLAAEERLGFLAATAVVVSTVASEPQRLAPIVAAVRGEIARRGGRQQADRFALGAGLSAMMRALNRHRGRDVIAFAGQTLRSATSSAWRSPLLWFLVARAVLSHELADLSRLRRLARLASS